MTMPRTLQPLKPQTQFRVSLEHVHRAQALLWTGDTHGEAFGQHALRPSFNADHRAEVQVSITMRPHQ